VGQPWNDTHKGNRNNSEKSLSQCHFVRRKSHWHALSANPDVLSQKSTTNRLGCGTADLLGLFQTSMVNEKRQNPELSYEGHLQMLELRTVETQIWIKCSPWEMWGEEANQAKHNRKENYTVLSAQSQGANGHSTIRWYLKTHNGRKKGRGWIVNTPATYSGSPGFTSHTADRLYWLKDFVFFLVLPSKCRYNTLNQATTDSFHT
jgi:hypothetical protein